LKWAGGKRWLIPHLLPTWEKHQDKRLVEPFAGGLAVTLGLRPRFALINDANTHLISFYKWLQHGLDLRPLAVDFVKDPNVYYRNRERFNNLIRDGKSASREAAALFYYLNRTGFNGLCRFNGSGSFNVPFGKYKSIQYREHFLEYREVLAPYTFSQGPFEDLETNANDFIYADPPYDVQFTSYSSGGFTWGDQERLATWLASRPGPVVASNQATMRVQELYEGLGFDVALIMAPRRISCDGNREDAREILATKGI